MVTSKSRMIAGVTGGANGIGRATALTLARNGCDIIVFDLPTQEAQKRVLSEQITALGGRFAYIPMDVQDSDNVQFALDQASSAMGIPDYWINSAGVVVRQPALDVSDQDWQRVLGVNLTGSFFCCRNYARMLVAAGKAGKIVNITSVFGLVGGPNRVAYSASKAGIVNMTRVLAYEWFRYNIRVNAVAPTFVNTPLTEQLINNGLDVLNRSFDENLATVQDVADAVEFLVSDKAQSITGHTLPVDLGWTAW